MIEDNWEEMFDFLDHMETDKVYDSMVFRDNDQVESGAKRKEY